MVSTSDCIGQNYESTVNFILHDNSEDLKQKKSQKLYLTDSTKLPELISEKLNDYFLSGYLAASVDSIVDLDNQKWVYINQGIRYSFINLSLQNFPQAEMRKIKPRLGKQVGKPVNLININQSKEKIIRYYEDNGYPFAKVFFDSLRFEEGMISANFVLSKGKKITIDSVQVKGDVKIRNSYIYRQTGIYPSSRYCEKKISESDKALNDVPFLSEIKPVEVEFYENKADVFLYLQKRKANRFNAIVGILPNNNETGKILFTGEIDLQLQNSLRRGEKIQFAWRKTENLSQKLNVDIAYPFVLSSPVGANYNLFIDKKDSSFLNVENKLTVDYFLNRGNYLEIFYRTLSSSNLLNNPVGNDITDVQLNVIGIGFRLKNLDYPYNPRKGIFIESQIAYGSKKFTNLNEVELNSNLNKRTTTQIDGSISFGNFLPIGRNFVLYLANKTEFINSPLIYRNELIKIGGYNSIRGFDEESILASAFTIFTMEIRFIFEKNSNIYIFTDGAYYEKNTVSGSLTDTPIGCGLGSSFQTKAGIFSISYAVGKQFDNPIEIKNAKIHFGLINYF